MKTKPLPAADAPRAETKPLRGTTQMAVQSAFRDFQQVLANIVRAAVVDGEVPGEGWVLDTDQLCWRKVSD